MGVEPGSNEYSAVSQPSPVFLCAGDSFFYRGCTDYLGIACLYKHRPWGVFSKVPFDN